MRAEEYVKNELPLMFGGGYADWLKEKHLIYQRTTEQVMVMNGFGENLLYADNFWSTVLTRMPHRFHS